MDILVTDVYRVIYENLTLKQVFQLKTISKSFDTLITELYNDDKIALLKQFIKLLQTCSTETKPFIYNDHLLYGADMIFFNFLTGNIIMNLHSMCFNKTHLIDIQNDHIIEHKLSCNFDNAIFLLFTGTKYFIIGTDKHLNVYERINNDLTLKISLNKQFTYYRCIDEEKNYIILATQSELIHINMLDLSINITKEKIYFFNPMFTHKYIVTQENDYMLMRLSYFDKYWKIFEHKTKQLNHIADEIIFMTYSVRLGYICLLTNNDFVLYSIYFDTIVYRSHNKLVNILDFDDHVCSFIL
jgi:hypothetical protein